MVHVAVGATPDLRIRPVLPVVEDMSAAAEGRPPVIACGHLVVPDDERLVGQVFQAARSRLGAVLVFQQPSRPIAFLRDLT